MFRNFDANTLIVSRTDPNDPFASYSKHGFDLDDAHWPSVEHYYQAMKFEDPALRERIRSADHPKTAARIARRNRRKVRKDWDRLKEVYMTRGTYIKCRTHPDIAEALMDTDDRPIVENSQYDYYWGCGRDTRGANVYGKVLTGVRERLRIDLAGTS